MVVYSRFEKLRVVGLGKGIKVVVNEVVRFLERRFGMDYLVSQPVSVQIESTTNCNLSCPFCISPFWGRRGISMSVENLKRVLSQFPILVNVNLQGVGEPLLNDDIIEIVKTCKSKRMIVSFTTNGTLLTADAAEKLVGAGLDYILVSLEGSSKEMHEKIKVGADFELVLENVRSMVTARGGRSKPIVLFHFVARRDNVGDIPEIIGLTKEIGADGVDLEVLQSWDNERLKEDLQHELLPNDAKTQGIIDLARKKADEAKLIFFFRDLGDRDKGKCRQLFRSCFITADGFVMPCSDSPDPRRYNLGNILTQDFSGIWNSREYRELRKNWCKGVLPDFCRDCTKPYP